MPDLYLHVGSNKTATTTLQYRLARSPESLAAAGVLYPRTGQSDVGAHHVFAGHLCTRPPEHFAPEGPLESLLDGLREEFDAWSSPVAVPRVVMSSEMLFWLRRNAVAALEALFSEFSRVRVLVYLRRQDSYLPSFYSSVVSNGNCPPPFEVFCEKQDLDYLANLDAWAGLVGADNVIARPFAPGCWVDGDITSDFLTLVGCDPAAVMLVDSESKNRALSAESIELLRAAGGAQSIPRFAGFREHIEAHFAATRATSSTRLMTPRIMDTLRERYDAGNREIGRRYFNAEAAEALAFPPGHPADVEGYRSLDPADYAGVARALWEAQVQLQEQLRDRERQLAGQRQQLERRDRLLAEKDATIARLREEPPAAEGIPE